MNSISSKIEEHTMNRLLKLCTMSLLLLLLTAATFAQEVLPLPVINTESAPRGLSITLNSPVNFGAINPLNAMSWAHIGAPGYTVKFKILQTGQTLSWKPQVTCAAVCTTTNQPVDLFNLAKDGNDVDWTVVGTVNGVKHTSETRRAILNEVQGVTGLTPSHFSEVYRNDVTVLKWSHDDINKKYVVTLKNADTGAIVIKQTVLSATQCWDASPYDLCALSINPFMLAKNTSYIWTLKITGFTGEKTTSGGFVFTTKGDRP
jgi:hypothetical protein